MSTYHNRCRLQTPNFLISGRQNFPSVVSAHSALLGNIGRPLVLAAVVILATQDKSQGRRA